MSISKPFQSLSSNNLEYVNFNDAFETENSIDKLDAEKLLRIVYEGIYNDTFPIPSEREDISLWLNNLKSGREKGQQLFSVFGRNLDKDNPEIMGFICCRLMDDSNCGLIEYIVRDKKYAKELHGIEMCEYIEKEVQNLNIKINKQPLKAIFWDANNPEKVKYDENNPDPMIDCMAPQKRIDIIEKKFGCEKLGFDYVQGPLKPCSNQKEIDERVCEELSLYQYRAKNYRDVTAADLKKFIINYNKTTNQECDPYYLNHPSINKMMNQLSLMEKENIPIVANMQTEEQKLKIAGCKDNKPQCK